MPKIGDEIISCIYEIDTEEIHKLISKFEKQIPFISRKLETAVNNEAMKVIRASFKARGFHSSRPRSYGDSGYRRNLRAYPSKPGKAGKIFMKQNAFYYNFIEFGTTHDPMEVTRKGKKYKVKGFSVPARPVLYPAADTIWRTSKASEIMEARFQKELKKLEDNK